MRTALLTLLSREWLALALALLLAVAGVAICQATPWLGSALIILGLLFAAGGIIHLATIANARRKYPPPGKMLDVAGTRIHLLAEGEAKGNLPIVWFGGGHASGLVVDHVHRALRGDTRSILIDRPGTGWSGTGRFPRTTVREAEEMVDALKAAGEKGPFVFAGYSFGGLLAANIARRYPELVARLVLIDPTPLETIVFGPRLGAIKTMRRTAFATGLLRLIGIHFNFVRWVTLRNPAYQEASRAFETELGPAFDTMVACDTSAGHRFAEYDIYRELIGPHVGTCGWETVVYDGDLGDMPVWLVAPGDASEVTANPDVVAAGGEQARMINFFARSRERYMAISSNSRRVVAPAGTTHQFVYERPDFIIETMREAIRPESR
jgi:pimeloyl-ACP methyl ester carboxylesterase